MSRALHGFLKGILLSCRASTARIIGNFNGAHKINAHAICYLNVCVCVYYNKILRLAIHYIYCCENKDFFSGRGANDDNLSVKNIYECRGH